MRYNNLGKSNLKISVIGLGCWAIGGRLWGKVDDIESAGAIRGALDLGINFFDTADFYGFGHSEELLGTTISPKADIVIATKVGLRWNKKGKIRHDLSGAYVRQACEASLKRLKREAIDLWQIHWPDPSTPQTETIAVIDALVKEGKVRYVGACNLDLEALRDISAYPWFVSYQGLFNLFDQSVKEDFIPFCLENDIAFIAYEPLSKGLLTGKFNQAPTFGQGDHRKYEDRFTTSFLQYKRKVDSLTREATSNNMTMAQLALAFLLHNGATIVIPGAKTMQQVQENAGAAGIDAGLLGTLAPRIEVLSGEFISEVGNG